MQKKKPPTLLPKFPDTNKQLTLLPVNQRNHIYVTINDSSYISLKLMLFKQ